MNEQTSAKYGFVYVLGNYSMPNVYKIGATTRTPSQRCDELSKATACPQEFMLLFYAEVEAPFDVEGWLHRRYASNRISSGREFFKLSFDDLDRLYDDLRFDSLTFCDHMMQLFCIAMNSRQQKLIDHFLNSGYADIEKPSRKAEIG